MGEGGILILASTKIERLEAAIRQKGAHLRDLQIGAFKQEGQNCYGVSFKHNGKPWELSINTNYPDLRVLDHAKIHLLETVLADIETRFRP